MDCSVIVHGHGTTSSVYFLHWAKFSRKLLIWSQASAIYCHLLNMMESLSGISSWWCSQWKRYHLSLYLQRSQQGAHAQHLDPIISCRSQCWRTEQQQKWLQINRLQSSPSCTCTINAHGIASTKRIKCSFSCFLASVAAATCIQRTFDLAE